MAENAPAKQRGRPFPKGTSGNPAGKPIGTRHKATQAALTLLEGEGEALTRKAVELALAGDTTALRLCLERLIPPRKERHVSVELPSVSTVADLGLVTSALLEAAGQGVITPGEAQALGGLVEAHRKALELGEIERRIAALENKGGKK